MSLAMMKNAMRKILVPLFLYNVSLPSADIGFCRSFKSRDDASSNVEEQCDAERYNDHPSEGGVKKFVSEALDNALCKDVHSAFSIALLCYGCKEVTA